MELYALKDLSSSGSDLQEVDIYYLEKLIHKGKGCTRLLQAQAPESDELIAIKLFPKKTGGQLSEGFTNEERLLADLSHPHLAKYQKLYRDALIKGKNEEFSQYSAIAMEYISSQDLFNVISNGAMTEKLARTVLKQIISVVEYLHNQDLAYLDLKLENFLVHKDGIKLIDLEGCRHVQTKLRGDIPQGSCGYRAPELVNGEGHCGRSIDMYALGVVLFTLVAGTPPYTEQTDNKENKFDQYYNALRNDKTKFWKAHEHYRVNDQKDPFSKDFKQIVEGLLEQNVESRWKMEEIKKSQWMKGETCSKEELMRGLGFCH